MHKSSFPASSLCQYQLEICIEVKIDVYYVYYIL